MATELPPPTSILATTATHLGVPPETPLALVPITGGGSDRCYFRLTGLPADRPAVVVMAYSDARPDNPKFFPATETLAALDVAIPKVIGHDPEMRIAWIEDLGETSLWHLRDDPWEQRAPCYEATLAEVARLHRTAEGTLPANHAAHLMGPFDADLYRWEQAYFFEHLVSGFGGLEPAIVSQLAADPALAELAASLADEPRVLVHRDFQSQNVILCGDGRGSTARRPFLIDYQGMRWGLAEYDLASLIFDPYVTFPAGARDELAHFHYRLLSRQEPFNTFADRLRHCAIQRLMQALGAYANLGINLGKPGFLAHIPAAIDRLLPLCQVEKLHPLGETLAAIRSSID
jgi:aminoglycoside/choline kinase family phosphotransferase